MMGPPFRTAPKPMRAALYARYSSKEKQSSRSVDDQIALCRDYATKLGADVVEVYADCGISGASMVTRRGIQDLMADAKRGRFDVVIAEGLDRLARDGEDTWAVFKRLRHVGIEINTVNRGVANDITVGIEGTMNALFLRDLAHKVHRGLEARAKEGLAACGIAYGYRKVLEFNAKGEPVNGKREIDQDERTVLLRIFDEYISGKSPRAIATALNRELIPAPRGGEWNASTINGNRGRKSGILHNELYIGFLVWNRQRWSKDPDTGTRVSRLNPTSEWLVVEVPHLRIIDDATWAKVQAVKASHGDFPLHVTRRPKKLLSGLLVCGCCGGGFTSISKDKFGCSAVREKGTCDNRGLIAYDQLEARVLAGLKSEMLSGDIVQEYIRTCHALAKERRAKAIGRRGAIEKELADIDRRSGLLLDLVCDGHAPPDAKDRLWKLEALRQELKAELAAAAEPVVVDLHPNLPAIYAKKVEAMQEALTGSEERRRQASAALRQIVEKIVLTPAVGGKLDIYVHGHLAEMLSPARSEPNGAFASLPSDRTTLVVAGTGTVQYRPPPIVIKVA